MNSSLYIPESLFVDLLARVNLKPERVPYQFKQTSILWSGSLTWRAHNFEMLIPAGKKYSICAVVYCSDGFRGEWKEEYKGSMPISLAVAKTDYYYNWRDTLKQEVDSQPPQQAQ